jgi:hypothetical protein
MDSFTLSIKYTQEDLQKAYKIHFGKIYPLAGKLMLILGLISISIGVGLLLFSYLAINYTNWFAWFLVVYGIILIIYYFWRINTMGRRMFAKMPDMLHSYEYTFSENGIRVVSTSVQSDNSWNYYCRYYIAPDIILLYPNKFRFNFFDRKHFTEEQFTQLRSWVTRNVPPTFKKK